MGTCLLIGAMLLELQLARNAVPTGTWAVKSATSNEEPIKLPERAQWRFTFARNGNLMVRSTGEADQLWKFARDASDAQVKSDELALTLRSSSKETTVLSTFAIQGNILKVAFPLDDPRRRPESFEPQKNTVVLILKRQKPGPDDMVPAKLPPIKRDPSRLVGKWERIDEADAKDTPERMQIEFARNLKGVSVRRETSRPFLFGKVTGFSEVGLPLIVNPDGRKDVLGVVVKIEEKGATYRFVPYNFQGETLEMLGEVTPEKLGKVNLTGRWQRVAAKK